MRIAVSGARKGVDDRQAVDPVVLMKLERDRHAHKGSSGLNSGLSARSSETIFRSLFLQREQ